MKYIDDNHFLYISKVYDYIRMNRLTQAQFAKKCGISTYRLSKVLNGDVKSCLYSIEKIAAVMNVDKTELININ